jgi:AraC-like DNA-binding protein
MRLPPLDLQRPVTLRLSERPLSPWLRLAHVTAIGDHASGRGRLRWCDDWMLMLQLEGTGFIWWQERHGSVPLPAGAIACVPPRRLHAWGDCPGSHIAIHFDLHAQPGIGADAMLHHREETVSPVPLAAMPVLDLRFGQGASSRIPLVSVLPRPGSWRERVDPLVAMYGARDHRSLPSRLRAAEILTWALSSLAVSASSGDGADPRILPILAELDADCARPWSVAALATRACMSPRAFRRAFRKATGTSPRRHLRALRIERARRLLIDTDRSVAVIAASVGFEDPFYFSRVFRRATGRSPRQMRG